MKPQPLVSIIIPTFNRAHLIGETLDSVLAQTYKNWECIIVDDGSTDNTDEVVGNYVNKDNRFQYYHRPDEHLPGGNGARNYGFKMSQGEYVNWLDSDDLFDNCFLREHINNITIKKTDVSVCDLRVFTYDVRDTKKWLSDDWKNTSYKAFCKGYTKFCFGLVTSCFVWQREFLNHKKLFCETLIRSQEYEFFCRILLLSKPKMSKLNNAMLLYRQHDGNKIQQINSGNNEKIISGLMAKKKVIGYIKKSIGICSELREYFISDALIYLKYNSPQIERHIRDINSEMNVKHNKRLICNYMKITKYSGFLKLKSNDITFLQKNVPEFLLYLRFYVFRKLDKKISRKLNTIGHS